MSVLTPPLKWPGGKHYLARRIVALMPPRQSTPYLDGWCHYVEPYFGGGAVLLANDPEGISEVVNDLNADLTTFWRVLQWPQQFEEFGRLVESIPFSEAEWEDSDEIARPGVRAQVAAAANFFVRCRQSLVGRMDGFATLSRTRTRRGMNEQASAWLSAVEGLPAVHARLKRVAIVGPKDALEVIHEQDGPRTLFYLDPPYLHETRSTTDEYGAHEMTEVQHDVLLTVLLQLEGKFLLSGYRSPLYDDAAAAGGWKRYEFDLPNHAAGGKSKRRMTECVWCNF